MENDNIWLIGFLILIIPVFFWLRVKAYNIRKKSVNVCCPSCGNNQRLPNLKNYRCRKCGYEVEFFTKNGTTSPTVKTYHCMACGAENFKGVITCTACGLANPAAI